MKKIKRIGLLFLVAILSLSVISGCSSDESETNTGKNSEAKKGEVSIGYVN